MDLNIFSLKHFLSSRKKKVAVITVPFWLSVNRS